jgi:NADPH-dependent 2,4-dienoyl-CoA reductase/sulfur reductase-like enzyme
MPIAVQPKMESPTVIVVGAGYAGLSTAIECTLRGMKVKMYESAKQLTPVGSWPLGLVVFRQRWMPLLPWAMKTSVLTVLHR